MIIYCACYKIGYPRNSKFFQVRTKTNRNSICFGYFSVCFAKAKFFSVCFGVSDRYRNNRNKLNFFETNGKNLQSNTLYQGVLETITFFRFEPKQTETQSVSVVFRFVLRNQQDFCSVFIGVSDRYRNNRNTTATNARKCSTTPGCASVTPGWPLVTTFMTQ